MNKILLYLLPFQFLIEIPKNLKNILQSFTNKMLLHNYITTNNMKFRF